MIRQSVVFCCLCSFAAVMGMAPGAGSSSGEHDAGVAPQPVVVSEPVRMLAQQVAALRSATDLAASTQQSDAFSLMHENLNTLRRGITPHESNALVRGVHPRVLASIDAVLDAADQKMQADVPRCSPEQPRVSSLTPDEKRTVVAARLIAFKQLLHALFASVDHNGVLCGDEPRVATPRVKNFAAGGIPLALVEAGEQFASTVHRMYQPCASCNGCARDLWCAECTEHIKPIPYQDQIERCAHEAAERIGVDDALTYLALRVGGDSHGIDEYSNGAPWVFSQEGFSRLQAFADAHKTILEWCSLHKVASEAFAHMSDDQLRVETVVPFLERTPGEIGFGDSAVRTAKSSWNPIHQLWAQPVCWYLGSQQTEALNVGSEKVRENGMTLKDLGVIIRTNVTSALGITDKELPILASLLHLFSCPANKLALKGATWIKDSSPAVDAFARDYSRPLREQYVTPACSQALELMAHAWKTGGVAQPQMGPAQTVPSGSHGETDEERVGWMHGTGSFRGR